MDVAISTVSFEHHREPLGIAEARPRISWRFEGTATNWSQSGYDLEITRGPDGVPKLYNTDDTNENVLVPWPDESLSSAESALVRVRSRGQSAQSEKTWTEWSDYFPVETGLLSNEDWAGAVPIAADRTTETDTAKRPVLFRKTFNLDADPKSARLYITALGLYIAELNGNRVGDHQLAPGYMSYQFRHTYDTYDVTKLITRGANAFGVTVGEGFWAGRFGFTGRNIWGDTLGVQALLVVTLQDGTTVKYKTGVSENWEATADGPIITSDIYDGEVYDSSKELPGWSTAGFKRNSTWLGVKSLAGSKVNLTSPDGAPMRKNIEVAPSEILTSGSGKTVIDFGQNLVGWLSVNVSGPAGTNITFRHAEVLLPNGDIATKPLRGATQTDTLLLAGNRTIRWEPHFTYHGFRYVEVTGWPTNSTKLDASNIKAHVVFSDMERTGSFSSSHELLNKFHENVLWSMRGNFLGVPTDCPQRDERLGWTGDAHAFAPTANYLYDASGFWRAWLRDVWSETDADPAKAVPEIVPTNLLQIRSGAFPRRPTAVWGDVLVGNPWALYQATGDREMLFEQYIGAQTWVDQGIPRDEATNLWDRSKFQYSDWLDPKAPPSDPARATTHKVLVADAYLIHSTDLLSKISAVLGKTDEAAKYSSDRASLVKAFNDEWITPYNLIANVTQTALGLGIRFDIFDNTTLTRAVETLHQTIEDNSYLVGTGFAGTQQLGFALSSVNLTSTFYKMLLQTQVPSWLYQVVMGGTTTWERWDSMLANGTINPGEMTSFNHYAFGSVADWIHQKIGGLAPAQPGWKVIQVAPEPGGGITFANSTYLSPYGQVGASWQVGDSGRGFDLVVTVPPNTKAEVTLPASQRVEMVGSGRHTFSEPTFRLE